MRRWRLLRRALLGVVLLVAAVVAGTRTGRYLVRAAWEEGRILARRRPIRDVLADAGTGAALRTKLRLVLDARAFALDSLGLRAGGEFTTVSRTDSDTLVLVLSAAYRDSLAFRGWWFPVVGRVPYKGFFDFPMAQRESTTLAQAGFDAVLRPASAFSTLGWFDDPVLPSTLAMDTLDLANTVIHELVHTTWYGAGQAVFNESLANFVGFRGAQRFFAARGQARAVAQLERRWQDEQVLGRFWAALYQSIDSAFAAHPGDRTARLRARDTLFAQARVTLRTVVAPQLRTIDGSRLDQVPLNTATVLSRRIYRTHLALFEGVLQREAGDVRRATDRLLALARATPRAPYTAICAWLQGRPAPDTIPDDPRADIRRPCGEVPVERVVPVSVPRDSVPLSAMPADRTVPLIPAESARAARPARPAPARP